MAMDTQGMRQTLSLYQGDTLLKQATSTWLTADAPAPGRLPYRAVLDTAKDASVGTYSTSTHTEWNFQSGAPEEGTQAVLPLLQLGYELDTDADGRAGREADLVVTPAHLPGADGTGAIGPVDLDVSYDDGVTWQKASLTRAGADGWKTHLRAPASARYLSIRASAQDAKGNAVSQTVIHAAGLR
jgi:hypothetical protein